MWRAPCGESRLLHRLRRPAGRARRHAAGFRRPAAARPGGHSSPAARRGRPGHPAPGDALPQRGFSGLPRLRQQRFGRHRAKGRHGKVHRRRHGLRRGVLFLDEMVEFPRSVLETMRQPLEDGQITISRTKHSVKYPAKFTLLGAMNPCPCGFLGDKEKHCTCSDYQIDRYRSRLSGPLLDRIDLHIEVPRLATDELLGTTQSFAAESSAQIRKRVTTARKIQAQRYAQEKILTNCELTPKLIKKYCKLYAESEALMKSAAAKYQLSGRRFDRILKLARTIADLDGAPDIAQTHLMQALQYRVPEILS